MTAAPQTASRRAAGLASILLFGLSLVASTWAWHYRLDDFPPWLDYDSAALGIFVNNISYRDHYDEFFRDSPKPHNVLRSSWAATFLPAMAPLSLAQRAIGVPPDRVHDLLEGAGLAIAALGLLCALALARHGGASVPDLLFLFGLVSTVPPFLVYLRTTAPQLVFSFSMFWLATLCIERYVTSGRRRWVYSLAGVLALDAMVPYVPMIVLPVVGLLLAVWRGAAGRIVRDPHLYAAAASSVVLFAALRLLVATSFEPSYEAWAAKTEPYLSSRTSHALSVSQLDPRLLPEKLTKLAHQHFWFRRDRLGDETRSDALWTMPEPQPMWLVLLVVAGYGMWRSRRDRDAAAAPFAAVLLATYGVALTVSYPEGRYMLQAVPALAFFVLQGLRALASDARTRMLVSSALLVAMAWSSFALVSGPYREWIVRQWQNRAGLEETLLLVRERAGPEYGTTRDLRLFWPQMDHEVWLYAQMLSNLHVRLWDVRKDLARASEGEALFAAIRSDDADLLREIRDRGFRALGTVTDPVIGRRVEVLVRNP